MAPRDNPPRKEIRMFKPPLGVQLMGILFLLGLLFLQAAEGSSMEKKIYWGALVRGSTYGFDDAPWDMRALDAFEEHAGHKVSILHWGQAWWRCAPQCGYQEFRHQRKQYDAVRSRGIIPFVDWASWDSSVTPVTDQPEFSLESIIEGEHDEYIRRWAKEAKAWGKPFFLRFNWEMNGDWFPWSEKVNGNKPTQFVLAWRHVYDIFAEVGAENVTWVWCPNVLYPGAIPLQRLYPGDDYVDWLCADGYNWGTHPVRPGAWQSFEAVFRPTYDALTALSPGKPILIGETASTEIGGAKATWIRNMLRQDLPHAFPRVEAVLWFNWNADGMDWVIESSPEATDAFAAGMDSGYFAGSDFADLEQKPIGALPHSLAFCLQGACMYLPAVMDR
jgi:hypothetical protein